MVVRLALAWRRLRSRWFGEDLLLIVRALLRRPVETLLLTVGIALAVGATVTATALTAGMAAGSERLLSSLRYREIVVTTAIDHSAMAVPARTLRQAVELVINDLHRVLAVAQAVQYAYATDETVLRLRGAGGAWPRRETVAGMKVTGDFFPARELTAAAGSLFTATELAAGEPVMVTGAELGATLFDDGGALDRTVVADHRLYRIVGVLAPTGTEVDQMAFVPAGVVKENRSAGEGAIKFDTGLGALRFTVTDHTLVDDAYAQVFRYFDAAYGAGVVDVIDPRPQAQAAVERYRRMVRVMQFLTLSALVIAVLTLSDTFSSRALRRRRSAGILRAVGAHRIRVFIVLFLDAAFLGMIGSPLGVAVASLLAQVMRREFGFGFGGVDLGLLLAGVGAAWLIVASCGILPAVAAARVPVADAVRYE